MSQAVLLNVPSLVKVDDYHEFDALNSHYRKLNRNLRVVEIEGLEFTGQYVGLVYLFGQKPAKAVVARMLKQAGCQQANVRKRWNH